MPLFETWRDVAGRVCATGWRDGNRHLIEVIGVGRFAFSAKGPAKLEAALADDVSAAARLRALRCIVLPLMAQARGNEILHASAVEMRGKVVAFVGTSHAGKSTFASALACRGWGLRADDAMCFHIERGVPLSIRLPCAPDLRVETREWLGAEMAHLRTSSSTGRLPIAALFVVEACTDESSYSRRSERLSPAAAFGALLPHAHVFTLQNRVRTASMVENYLSLAEAVPVFRLRRPQGFVHLPATLDAIEGAYSDSVQAA